MFICKETMVYGNNLWSYPEIALGGDYEQPIEFRMHWLES